ncbi:MAG: dienelactone hydrolase family protein [Planctomycetia bacterium]
MTLTQAPAAFEVAIPAVNLEGEPIGLPGRLTLPESPLGIVLFAHGSGSSRLSPRNAFVAGVLHEARIGTLLFDLLTEQEATDRANVFDIRLLADRLGAAARFTRDFAATRSLPVALCGASTGAAAALVTAAEDPDVAAVVSRGGRADLAGAALGRVRAPTLLIVGGDDQTVLELNRQALRMLGGDRHLAVVPGATHLFEEPGALEEAARLAAEWCGRHLGRRSRSGAHFGGL